MVNEIGNTPTLILIEETKMPTNRFSLLVVISVITGLAILSMSMISSGHRAASNTASSAAYDQVELVRAERYAAAAAQQAYLDYRHGEWTGK